MCTTDGQAHAGSTEAGDGGATGYWPSGRPSRRCGAGSGLRAGWAGLPGCADPASLTGAERADLLRGLAAAESQHLAARSAVLAGFDRAGDYAGDAAASAKSWLRWQARVSRRGGRRGGGVDAAAGGSPAGARGAGCRSGDAVVAASPLD